MRAAVTVSYFHRKIGPMVYYTYPEDALSEEEKTRLADIMDQAFEESFFAHQFGDLNSLNFYFEIQSEWARGNKEMLMVSVILDIAPNPGVNSAISTLCSEFATRLKNVTEIYKAFYNVEEAQDKEQDQQVIKKYNLDLRFWVKELYWVAIEELREKTEEEKWASIMSQPQIFKIITKLSKGPMMMENLQKFFQIYFPHAKLNACLEKLEQEKFIFRNTIGQETFVFLVKDVNITRSPPICILDLWEDSPELFDLTEIYSNEVREFFDNYKPSPSDSFDLFKLFADPKIYNVISQLREGPLAKEKIFAMTSEKTTQLMLKNLRLLKEKDIIQEFSYGGENLYILKSDVVLTATFPEYLKKLLPQTKDYTLQGLYLRQRPTESSPEDAIENRDVSDDNSDSTSPSDSSMNNQNSNQTSLSREEKKAFEEKTQNTSNEREEKSSGLPQNQMQTQESQKVNSSPLIEIDDEDLEEQITPEKQRMISAQFKVLIQNKKEHEKSTEKSQNE
jgi:hypothetical protein